MVKPHAEPVPVAGRGVISVIVISQDTAVIHVCGPGALLLHISLRASVHVVPVELHVVVQQIECPVGTGHPGCGDAVAAPAACAAAHSAGTSHRLHHASRNVIESPVVGIVPVQNDADLAVVRKTPGHSGCLIAPVACISDILLQHVMTAAGHHIAEPSVHHPGLHGQVYNCLLVTVIYSGELGLLGFLLHHTDLLDYLGRDVLGGKLRVVKEEFLPVYHHLSYGLPVGGDRSVRADLHTWQFLEQFLQHVIVGCLEGRCTVFYGVLFDYDGVADSFHSRSFKDFHIRHHLHLSQVDEPVHRQFLLIRLVAHQLRLQYVCAADNAFEDSLACLRAHYIFQRLLGPLQGHGYGGKADRLARSLVGKLHLHGKSHLRPDISTQKRNSKTR